VVDEVEGFTEVVGQGSAAGQVLEREIRGGHLLEPPS
jgi:hypothetical protein